MFLPFLVASISVLQCVWAHGEHAHQAPVVPADADWATRHMAEEHHISEFDAGSFFALHDYDGTNEWTIEDLRKTYGFTDESTKHIPRKEVDAFLHSVIDLFDRDVDGSISFAEYTIGVVHGNKLPSPPGGGPGHHGDDEYEYEIHHFELYHDENTREEDLTHPEDIAHFRKHEEMEQQAERQERLDRTPIVEANIPMMFRRPS